MDAVPMTIPLRLLTPEQRAQAFVNSDAARRRAVYRDTVREMEGGEAYAIALNGVSPRTVHVNMNRAARSLGLTLRWAPARKDATELIVELAEPEDGLKRQAQHRRSK